MPPTLRRQAKRHRQSSGPVRSNTTLSQTTTLPYVPAVNSSLLNFVDASILSKLELPTFDGNILEYPEFSSRFATLVGNKVQLDDTTKFSLLKSCLRGRALHAIQGLSMTPNNYKIAMDILATHFDDKVTMKHILYTKLSQLPNCDQEGRNLQTLYNQMFALVRQFAEDGNDSNETGLGAILLNKLPARVRSQIYDKTNNSHNLSPTELLHLLTDIVRKEAALSEIDYHACMNRYPSSHELQVEFRSKPQHFSYSTQKRKECSFCRNSDHTSLVCDSFPTPRDRTRRVEQLRLCYNCLSSQHGSKDCTSKQSCRFCAKRHHSSLCPKCSNVSNPGREIPQPGHSFAPNPSSFRTHEQFVSVSPKETTNNPHQQEDNIIPIVSSPSHQNRNIRSQATLMCTSVALFNPANSSKTTAVTAFFDSGSTQSYITDELARVLDLQNMLSEEISVSTFGTTTPLRLKSRNHVVGIKTEKGEKHLQVKSLPTLTGHLRHAHPDSNAKNGNVTISSCKPSILIGNDYFWDIVLSDDFYYETLPNGYRMLHTSIGNILVGKSLNLKSIATCTSFHAEGDLNNPVLHDELSELVQNFWKLEAVRNNGRSYSKG
ncbi:Tas retrotransposon peptidase A16 [Ostertagia ostertagi]